MQFPSIYWNCACLITNSGGNEDAEEEENDNTRNDKNDESAISELVSLSDSNDNSNDESEEEETDQKNKKKARNTNYGKIATAIGTMQQKGVLLSPPDINKSPFTFVPDREQGKILYGIKGINRIGDDLVNQIINNRPYTSIKDFLSKVKVNKPQMVILIKSGAFDSFGKDRITIMRDYIDSITDKKKRLTLQNMQMLIKYNLLPKEFTFEIKVYNFNKYLKKCKTESYYYLDEIAFYFYEQNFDMDLVEFKDRPLIKQTDWDSIYNIKMNVIRAYLKANKDEILEELNKALFNENWEKYCLGNISKWEMDSISFYLHRHELADIKDSTYNICDFNKLPEEPELDHFIFIGDKQVPLFKLHRIAGTVLDKNKAKNSISLLTKYGVVNVKIYQAQFAKYDKQISERLPDGAKKIVEKSWFTRGNKLLLTGIRRGDQWVIKTYKSSQYKHPIQLITNIFEDGTLEIQNTRTLED